MTARSRFAVVPVFLFTSVLIAADFHDVTYREFRSSEHPSSVLTRPEGVELALARIHFPDQPKRTSYAVEIRVRGSRVGEAAFGNGEAALTHATEVLNKIQERLALAKTQDRRVLVLGPADSVLWDDNVMMPQAVGAASDFGVEAKELLIDEGGRAHGTGIYGIRVTHRGDTLLVVPPHAPEAFRHRETYAVSTDRQQIEETAAQFRRSLKALSEQPGKTIVADPQFLYTRGVPFFAVKED